MSKRCLGCMKIKESSPICEHCGYNENVPNYPNQLPVGMTLHGQYTIGKVLGQGGFGITYIGWDNSLEATVAIKEFFPSGVVNRDCQYTQTVSCNGEEAEKVFHRNRERFLKEAKILAKLQNIPGIVRVQNLFSENNTVYIVMEYVKGIDLRHYIRMKNRSLTVEETFSVMRPILYSMHKVHEAELVHRDISPDNIMMLPDGTVKLLDFGAARTVEHAQVDKELPESTETILKHGFAPIEQYSRRGNLGPWTDVYAMCATIYYCLTGRLPNAASERVMGDDNVDWRSIPGLTETQIETLEKGLALLPENRLQTMEQLYRGLFEQQHGIPKAANVQQKTASAVTEPKKKKKSHLPLIAAVLAVIVAAAGLFLLKPKEEAPAVSAQETTPAIGETTEPMVTVSPEDQKRYDEAVALEESGKKAEAAMAFGALGDVLDARQRSFNLWAEVTERKTIAAGCDYTAAVKKDGSVVFDGWMDEDWQGIEQWENIIALSASLNHLVGLKDDGTVVAAGRNQDGQCDVSQWRDIVAIACGESHTVGLKSDGTVVAVGNNIYYEKNIHRLDVERWSGIVSVDADNFNTVGIRTDGTVIVTGYFENWDQKTVIDWTDITGVSAGAWYIVGVKSDGTAVAGGEGQYQRFYVKDWTDIVAVSTGYMHAIGLKSDGTVVAVGRNKDNFAKPCGQCDVKEWKNMVDIDAGWYHSVGLCADGTVLVTGRDMNGSSWKEWTDILLPGEKLQKGAPEPVTEPVSEPESPLVGQEAAYAEAEALAEAGEHAKAGLTFGKLGDYRDAPERSFEEWGYIRKRQTIDTNSEYWIGVKNNGTVVTAGSYKYTYAHREVSDWTDIVEVHILCDASIGLKSDGTLVIAGEPNKYCADVIEEISQWTNIESLRCDRYRNAAIGLEKDGTVVTAGFDSSASRVIEEWRNIREVYFNSFGTIGLRFDGSVIAYGAGAEIEEWTDVVSMDFYDPGFFTLGRHIVGNRVDSTAYVVWDDFSDIDWSPEYSGKIESRTDILETCGPVVLHSDGTVSVFPNDAEYVSGSDGTNTTSRWEDAVKDWTGIVALLGDGHSAVYGLKEDGTVVAAGSSWNGSTNVSAWTDIKDILNLSNCTIGIKSDGSIMVAEYVNLEIEKWTDIQLP